MAVQLTAVMILAIFYGCYFSKMLAQRRKGIQTDQMGKGKTGEARTIELTMKVTTLLVPLVEMCIRDRSSTTRASLYFYNTVEEIDALVESVGSVRRRMGYGE